MTKARIVPLSDLALSILVQIAAGADLAPGRGVPALLHQDLRRRGFVEQTLRRPDLGPAAGHRWTASTTGRAELAREAKRVAGLPPL